MYLHLIRSTHLRVRQVESDFHLQIDNKQQSIFQLVFLYFQSVLDGEKKLQNLQQSLLRVYFVL